MTIRVLRYTPSASPLVAAFVNIEVDGWLCFNGLNYNRDGTLRSAQLTPWRNGKRLFFDAVEILDADLRGLLIEEILAAIHTHVATLPPEKRTRPARLPAVPLPTSKKALPPPRRLATKGGRS